MRYIDPVMKQRFEEKIHAGDSALITNFWVGRPTTPLTNDKYLEWQQVIASGVSKTAIAVSHPRGNTKSDRIYLAYVANGTAQVKSAAYRAQMKDHIWVQETFAEYAEDVAICFDSIVKTSTKGIGEFITEDFPYVFWVHDGVLTVRRLGLLGDIVLAQSNCTKVTAVRAAYSKSGGVDFGLIVFFLLSGSLYYRQLINGEWMDAEVVTHVPSEVTISEIAAFRTWDYRVGLHMKTSDGKVYCLLSQYQGIAKHGAEHIHIADIQAQGQLTPINYAFTKEVEHISLSIEAGAPYGGLYQLGAASIVGAYNLDDGNGNYGHKAVFVFDRHINAVEVAAQNTAFRIVDSNSRIFVAQNATVLSDGFTVELTFSDFNSAYGSSNAVYLPGTVHTMAGIALGSLNHPIELTGLVPPSVPAPELQSIENF